MKQTKTKKVLRRIVVRNSPIHGRGVFALRPIPKGTRIIEYKGKLITDEEADRRFGRLHENSSHTMLFSVDDGLVIDATRQRQLGALDQSLLRAQLRDRGRKSSGISSKRAAISEPGEELAYDYNLQIGEKHTKKAKRDHACLCGAKRCRGTMLGEDE